MYIVRYYEIKERKFYKESTLKKFIKEKMFLIKHVIKKDKNKYENLNVIELEELMED